MFAELFFVAASQSCQSGQCPKPATTTTTTTTTIVNGPQTAPLIFIAPEPPRSRLRLPNLFQRPVVVICAGGKCK